MTRVVAIIFHPGSVPGAGPLSEAFEAIRRRNAVRQAIGFRQAGADNAIVDEGGVEMPFGQRLREALDRDSPDGLIVLGSGAIPLATAADRQAFVEVAAGPQGRAMANNRYSADVVAIAGARSLAGLPDLAADNGLPRWLKESAGFEVADLRQRWRLQVDLDTPLDALLTGPTEAARELDGRDVSTVRIREALARVQEVSRDPRRELVVAGRASAGGLGWLERSTASRTRALVEERGFRTRPESQRPVRSSLGLLLDREGPTALGALIAELGDGALVDSRVLLAHHFGADERCWPIPEDRYASDLLLADRIADPWLRALTTAARDAPIAIVLGGHSLVGPGLRLVLGGSASWT